MLEIKIESKRFNCEVTLKHKITVFIGDSGRGKTQFANAVTNASKAFKVTISENFTPVILKQDSWRDILDATVRGNMSRILIVDDMDFVFSREFVAKFKDVKNSYLVVINRASILQHRFKHWSGLSISAEAFQEFYADGINHYTRNATKFNTVTAVGKPIDLCLCEDKGSGREFFEKIFTNVDSSCGKDKILTYLKDNESAISKMNIYLCVDYAAIGYVLKEASDFVELLGGTVTFSTKYQSFEYMLLKSNMFNIDDSEIQDKLLEFSSLETRCTALLEEKTLGKPYHYSKGKLSQCYYLDCCKPLRKSICDKGLGGDKISALLVGTEFEFLLKLRQVF